MKKRQSEDEVVDSPQQVGRYEMLSEIGRGSMGRVFVAYDPNIERRVAIKILQPSFRVERSDEADFQRRFVIEARAAGRLSHPGIVSIYDAAIDPRSGLAYIAMELIEGASVARLVERNERLPASSTAAVGHQVALALDYAHGQGVVHRDIKPANVLVGYDGRVKVLDFGIAKLNAEPHTAHGQVLGTPAYMSPEQVKGAAVDGRSDLFSLGAVLCECLTGDAPFDAETVATIVYKILHTDPIPLEDPESPLPVGLWNVVTRSLEKEPDQRYASGRDLALALEEFLPPRDDDALANLLPRASLGHAPRPGDAQEDRPGSAIEGTFVFAAPSNAEDQTVFTPTQPRREDRSGRKRRIVTLGVLVATTALLLALLVSSMLRRSEPPPISPRTSEAANNGEMDEGKNGEQGAADQGSKPPGVEEILSEPSGDALAKEEATLVVLHENRLKSARMTIWINGEEAWSETLSIRGGFFARTRGRPIQTTLAVPAGLQTIEVRITGAKRRVDAAETTKAEFVAGQTRLLRARLIPFVHNLELDWQD